MLQQIVLHLVKWYQKYLSPLTPPSCRYYPTCSNYMIMAVKKHGVFLGLIMGIARIIRCNPFVRGGVDFVPDQFTLLRNPHPEQYEDEIIARKFHPPK
ncbi:putative membrane protein insertion efficiency factor [Bombilactobacillus mellifer]|uniref:Putative membrane protein insertion efficiency factor n=1 Tax=Bombilactobacillus mellifer TaxID=1218492 RepID=A0A0F4LT10_9LACO|nr:membrane protein insertion efficiency factor YidD [Bombilactobacillus mellifer]MBH9990580.1 membrane protein insertion efficiency factor YidD [Lactobacillus sp. W8092]KJY61937.1 putative membrane protein insertion efficiency factor [Bombilactobacillus mellifer]MCT6825566.1 membrane protein insertion efficiency factor YidD [Bombilactobacillus mellifer]MCT6843387.1 membrane protein insertion efficiency factor YidD [Bombilactobacillus mellifer]MCT6893809.1 membrane protein insertion efficiency